MFGRVGGPGVAVEEPDEPPVDALPPILQPIARILPTTHVFAAARTVIDGQPLPWDQLAYALVGTIVLAGLGVFYVTSMLRTFRHRGYVTPEDVKAIGPDVLRHRVVLTYEAEAEEVSAEQIVRRVVEVVEVP